MTDNNISPHAYHPSNDSFEQPPAVDDSSSPASITEVEQLIRVAISIGGIDHGLELAQKAITFQKQHEQNNVFDDFVVDRDNLDASNDIWLQNNLQRIHDDLDDVLDQERQLYDNRMEWYDDTIPNELQDKINRSLRGHDDFFVKRVHPDTADTDELGQHDIRASRLDNEVPLDAFDIDLPQKLVIHKSDSSGKLYPFIPWQGVLSCTCGYKQENPVSTVCKHEVAALSLYSRDEWDPDGPPINEHYRSLISQEAYNRFMENISI